MTYAWALIIVIVMVGLLFYFVTLPQVEPQNTCQFQSDLICTDFVITSNSATGSTIMYLNATNFDQYPLENPVMTVSLNGQNTTGTACYPDYVLPGEQMVCTVAMQVQTGYYQTVSGALYITASDCGLVANFSYTRDCINPPAKLISGSYYGHTTLPISFPFGYVYCIGDSAASPYNESYYAPLDNTGMPGNWVQTANYPIPLTGAGCATYQKYIYCVGTNSVSVPQNQSYYGLATSSGISNWTVTTPYPIAFSNAGCSIYNSYIYCIGTSAVYPYNQTYYAKVSGEGIGPWTQTTSIPANQPAMSCAIYNGYVYCAETSLGGYPKYTYYAPVSSSGIGQWTSGPDYPQANGNDGCTEFGGYFYCINTNVNKDIVYSQLTQNWGVTGNWLDSGAYPIKEYDGGCNIFNGYIYCFGTTYNPHNTQDVFYAPLTANGVGNWVQSSFDYPIPFYGAYCTVPGSSGGFTG